MRSSAITRYAFRLNFGQSNQVASQSSASAFTTIPSPDRVITRSATMLAVFGIALSSFSLKQMLANSSSTGSGGSDMNKTSLRKF